MAYLPQDLQNRVDAYRGNPQGLQERYGVTQQLIDLLALQQIKADKEAAARQMQMDMAQQQAAQGMPPTIAQSVEGDVSNMARQELVGQITKTLEQQQQKRQANIQNMANAGIPQAPGAGQAMPTQAMAAGGIVAFQTGGDVDKEEELQLTEPNIPELPRPPGLAQRKADPQAMEKWQEEYNRVQAIRDRARIQQELDTAKREGAAFYKVPGRGFVGAEDVLTSRLEAPQKSPVNAPVDDSREFRRLGPISGSAQKGIEQIARPRQGPAAPAMPAAPTAPAAPPQQDEVMKLAMEAARGNPNAAQKARDEYQRLTALDPKLAEQYAQDYERKRKLFESGIKGLKPEGVDWEGLTRFATGMGGAGRNIGNWAIGGAYGAAAAQGLDKERRAEQERMTEGLLGLSKGRVAEDLARRKEIYNAGAAAEKLGAEMQRAGITAAMQGRGHEIQAETARRGQDVTMRGQDIEAKTAQERNALTAEANKIAREGQALQKGAALMEKITTRKADLRQKEMARFDKVQKDKLVLFMPGAKLNPQQQAERDALVNEHDRVLKKIDAELNAAEQSALSLLGIGSGFKVLGKKQKS